MVFSVEILRRAGKTDDEIIKIAIELHDSKQELECLQDEYFLAEKNNDNKIKWGLWSLVGKHKK